jgi:hypothetical protein
VVGKGLTLEFMSVRFEENIGGEASRRSFIALHLVKGTAFARQLLSSRAHVSGDQRQGQGFSLRGSDRLQDRTCSCCYSRVSIETKAAVGSIAALGYWWTGPRSCHCTMRMDGPAVSQMSQVRRLSKTEGCWHHNDHA